MAATLLMAIFQTALACPDRQDLIEDSHRHLLSAEYSKAEDVFASFEASLSCGLPPTPQLLAHYWFVQGVWFRQIGDGDRAQDYLNQAILDGFWDDRYGIEPWTAQPVQIDSYLLSDQIKNGDLWLNQQPASAHTPARTGPNLVQWLDAEGRVLDGSVFWAPPKSVHYLSPHNSRWPALKFRNAAKWSAISAAGFSTLAVFQNYRMNQADNLEQLNRGFGFQVAFASLGILSGGMSTGFYLQYRLY